MNKTITVYELLGLIKDGKAPKKIEYQGNILEFDKEDYKFYVGADVLSDDSLVKYISVGNLNEKVEILEEDKPIQKNISRLSYQQIGTYQLDNNDILGFIKALNEQLTKHGRKLNEIIDYINRKEDK